ncbi:MAG: hypothetical protein ABEH35_02285, partial [Haloarculaceae archaeon]
IAVIGLILLAGCSGFSNGDVNPTTTPESALPDETPTTPSPTPEPTPEPTPTSSPTPTPTATPEPTPEPTPTPTPTPTKAEKFAQYAEDYKETLNKSVVTDPQTQVDVPNNTVHITVYIDNATYRNHEDAIWELLVTHSALIGSYMDPPDGVERNLNLAWVPMYLNTTVKVEGEGVYHTSHITKFMAMDFHQNKIDYGTYRWQYYGNMEIGPASPTNTGKNTSTGG